MAIQRPTPPELDLTRLRTALTSAGLDPDFGKFSTVHIGRFSNDVWRLDLDNGVRLLAKVPYRPPRPDEPAEAEGRFYRLLQGRSELPVPRFVAQLDDVLLLEYLDLEPFNFRTGVTTSHADAAITALARWHAAWWQAELPVWLDRYGDADFRQRIQQNYDQAWRLHGERLLEHAPEFEPIGTALVGSLAGILAPLAEPATLNHGDAHAENIPVGPEGAVLLDWQTPQSANPGLDLAVFTTMSFPLEDRKTVERAVVEQHANQVRALGCDWPDPWNDYRLGVLRRAARIVEIADVNFSSLPWVFRRSAVAAVDLKVDDLFS